MQRLLAAPEGEVPYEAMEELIELSSGHEDVRHDLLAEMDKQLWNADRDMALAWLCLVAGEAGRDGLRKLIELLGLTDSDDVAEAAIPSFTRHVLETYADIKAAVRASRVADQRCCLYEGLRGAVVLGDAGVKRDLEGFARERVRVELERPPRDREVAGPLHLLVYLGAPDARERLGEVRRWVRDKDLRMELQEMESHLLGGSEDPLSLTRAMLKEGWRDTAANLRKLFRPTKEEERQLRELMATLKSPGRGVH